MEITPLNQEVELWRLKQDPVILQRQIDYKKFADFYVQENERRPIYSLICELAYQIYLLQNQIEELENGN